mmetsp:Transcript_25050/g.82077  ORF Transcript_25050/g.82077 Transcript_25050/m.82077 type:complete len:226 (-) Transcript_25050:126-803(-)
MVAPGGRRRTLPRDAHLGLRLLLPFGEHLQQLLLRHSHERPHLARVIREVKVGGDGRSLNAVLVDGGAVVGARRELLGGEETEVQLLSANVDLRVPLTRLLQERDAAVLRRLAAVAPSLGPERRHELRLRHTRQVVQLARVLLHPKVGHSVAPRLVDGSSVERACSLLLRVMVPERCGPAASRNLRPPLARRPEERHAPVARRLRRHAERLARRDLYARASTRRP